MSDRPATALTYFAQLPTERATALLALRAQIFGIWPALHEDMAYGVPTYHLNDRPLFALASHKHFLVFYVVPYDLLEAFKHELLVYNRGKSCMRMKRLTPEAAFLVERIVRFVGATHTESRVSLKPLSRL